MALLTIKEVTPTIELFHVVDPASIVDVEVNNNTGEVFELTFVKDVSKGGDVITISPDDTVAISNVNPGDSFTITAQMFTDALAAGNHTDVYRKSKRENQISTAPKFNYVYAGQTVNPSKKSKAKDEK
jgi:hypothetical protein